MKQYWRKCLCGLLSIIMVLSVFTGCPVGGMSVAEAAEGDKTVTLYYYYEKQDGEVLCLNLWQSGNGKITFADTTKNINLNDENVYGSKWGWAGYAQTLEKVKEDGYENWYFVRLLVKNGEVPEKDGFTVYAAKNGDTENSAGVLKHNCGSGENVFDGIAAGNSEVYAVKNWQPDTSFVAPKDEQGFSSSTESDVTFTFYYYYEGDSNLYMDIWNHEGLDFGTGAVTDTSWGWKYNDHVTLKPQAVLQSVEGKTNWYFVELNVVSGEAKDGFDLYAGGSSTKIDTYDKETNKSQGYQKLVSGDSEVYAVKDGVIYESIQAAEADGASAGEVWDLPVVENAGIEVNKVENLSKDFIMGMDISSAISEFESGVVFKDWNGKVIDNLDDFCAFLYANGITHIRVRVWNNPYDADGNGYGGGNNDVAKAKKFADACRKAGLKMLVDFHCSDFWTDPGKQIAPKAWKKYTLDQKKAALKAFIKDSLDKIDAAKDTVAMVQVGNETINGFVGETDTEKMCALFLAGAEGVKEYNTDVEVVIHVTNPEKGNVTKWAGNLDTYHVNYDIIATSYYPYWHGSLTNLKEQFNYVNKTYGKKVMVAETSYAYTLEDSDGHSNTVRPGNNDTSEDCKESFTVQGQAASIRNLIDTVNSAKGGIGVFYWEPAWRTVGDVSGLEPDSTEYKERVAANKSLWETKGSGWASSYSADYDPDDAGKWYGGTAVDNEAMFYPDGSPTEGLHVWNYVKSGAECTDITVEKIEDAEISVDYGKVLNMPGTVNVFYNKGKKEETVTWNREDLEAVNTEEPMAYLVRGTARLSETVTSGKYAGEDTVPAVCKITVYGKNLLENPGFENSESSWEIRPDGSGVTFNADGKRTGGIGLHYWNQNAFSFMAEQVVTLPAGTYTIGGYLQGGGNGEDDVYQVYVKAGTNEQTACVEPSGYLVWKNPEIKKFELAEESEVTVGIKVTGSAGAWGTWDDMYVYEYNPCENGHTLVHIPQKAATSSGTGNKEYWECSGCGKLFADKNAAVHTTLADVTIAKVNHSGSYQSYMDYYVMPEPAPSADSSEESAAADTTGAQESSKAAEETGTQEESKKSETTGTQEASKGAETTEAQEAAKGAETAEAQEASKETEETGTQEASNVPETSDGQTVSVEKEPAGTSAASEGLVVKNDQIYTVNASSSGSENTLTYSKTNDDSVKSVTIPASVKKNGVTFKVTAVAENAFKNNKTIVKVKVGSNVEKIGKNAFFGAKKLKSVILGKKVKAIGANAFKNTGKLKTLVIKSSRLTMKGLKNALKGSSIKVVKLEGKAAEKMYSVYKKYFTKKNCGKKVTVKK